MNPSVQNDDARFMELLKRWQGGDFTRADEQELQKLMRADDFRREAMEGFMSMPEPDHAARLETLRSRLKAHKDREKGRVVPLFQWLAIAASLTLLIGVAIFFPKIQSERNAEPVAQTAPGLDSAIAYEEAPSHNPEFTEAAPSKSTTQRKQAGEPGNPASSTVGAEQNLEQKAKSDTDAADLAEAEETYKRDDKPLRSSQTETPAGNLDKDKDALKKAQAPSSQSDIVTTPSNSYPNAAPSRPGDARAKKSQAPAKEQSQNQNRVLAGQPLGGWSAFQEYLRQNARLTDNARNNNISGSVRLQFEVNEAGKPVNIKVLRRLGYGCDEEAERLLENWKWTESAVPLSVDIPFIR